MLYRDGKLRRLYRGDHKPLTRYRNVKKIYGWHKATATVFPATIESTYNDTADVTVRGNTVQKSEWVRAEAVSAQDGTPTPDNPIPVATTVTAGTYKTQDWRGDWYEFTLTEDLHGIDDVRDSVEWDKYSHAGFLRGRTGRDVLDGTIRKLGKNDAAANNYGYNTVLEGRAVAEVYCTHFKHGPLNLQPSGVGTFTGTYSARHIYVNMYGLVSGDNATVPNPDEANAWLAAQYVAGTPVAVVYQLATPTRTTLTFTKNNASTAPECPMEFLASTPSEEYRAEVWDAEGA